MMGCLGMSFPCRTAGAITSVTTALGQIRESYHHEVCSLQPDNNDVRPKLLSGALKTLAGRHGHNPMRSSPLRRRPGSP